MKARVGIRRMEKGHLDALEVELHEQADGVAAVAVAARGVDPVTVGGQDLPGFRMGQIGDARADARVRFPALVEPRSVFD